MEKKSQPYTKLARKFKALAHPARIKLLGRLAKGECCVTEIKKCLDISQPNVSQHLKTLKLAGIIEGKRTRTKICYKISDERVLDILKTMLEGET
jgi:DNA-binding transcriptional ArsR family regulator